MDYRSGSIFGDLRFHSPTIHPFLSLASLTSASPRYFRGTPCILFLIRLPDTIHHTPKTAGESNPRLIFISDSVSVLRFVFCSRFQNFCDGMRSEFSRVSGANWLMWLTLSLCLTNYVSILLPLVLYFFDVIGEFK